MLHLLLSKKCVSSKIIFIAVPAVTSRVLLKKQAPLIYVCFMNRALQTTHLFNSYCLHFIMCKAIYMYVPVQYAFSHPSPLSAHFFFFKGCHVSKQLLPKEQCNPGFVKIQPSRICGLKRLSQDKMQ